MKYGVFVSYSHEDTSLVSRVVPLVRALREDLVFQDVDMKPGKPWESQLEGALDEARMIIVFWCEHSSTSDYVRREYETAIQQKKDVLPLLLDNSPLSEPLKAYQWVDFRKIVKHRKVRRSEISTQGKMHRTESTPNGYYPINPPSVGGDSARSKAGSWFLVLLLAGGVFLGVYLLGKIPFFQSMSSPWSVIVRIISAAIIYMMGLIMIPVIIDLFHRIKDHFTFKEKMNKDILPDRPPKIEYYHYSTSDMEAKELAFGIVDALKERIPREPEKSVE